MQNGTFVLGNSDCELGMVRCIHARKEADDTFIIKLLITSSPTHYHLKPSARFHLQVKIQKASAVGFISRGKIAEDFVSTRGCVNEQHFF